MTEERKKALMVMTTTLIVGIVIGILISGLWGRSHNRRRMEPEGREKEKMGFVSKLLQVVDANPDQVEKIKPILNETIAHIDSIQVHSEGSVRSMIDSLEIKLKPILSEAQFEKLKNFNSSKKRGGEQSGKHH